MLSLLELTPCCYEYYFKRRCYTICNLTINGLCKEFQHSEKHRARIICSVGGVNVFDKESAITCASIKTGNDDMNEYNFVSKVSANGSLFVDVKVELHGVGLDFTPNPVKSYKTLAENIGKMLQNSQFFDFTFIVQGQEFKVHRNILAQASPVFTALFSSDMEEAKSKKCVIKFIKPSIFGHLLNYIYKFELPQDFVSVSKELYEAAHYYEITELKDVCLRHVSSTLTVNNAFDLFHRSIKYDENLKVKAWTIIKR